MTHAFSHHHAVRGHGREILHFIMQSKVQLLHRVPMSSEFSTCSFQLYPTACRTSPTVQSALACLRIPSHRRLGRSRSPSCSKAHVVTMACIPSSNHWASLKEPLHCLYSLLFFSRFPLLEISPLEVHPFAHLKANSPNARAGLRSGAWWGKFAVAQSAAST